MKKITFLFTLLFASALTFGQVVLSEDFEAGLTIPAGWTVEDLAVPVNGEIWTIETGGAAGGFTAGNTLVYDAGGAGNYATFNSDGYGNNNTPEESTLTSPVFDCSSLTSVTLGFDTVYNGNYGGLGEIEVYNGTSWVTIQTYVSVPGGTPSTTIIGSQTFDVPELVGVTNAQVRFRWTGDWSISWSIDNISVFQCTDALPGTVGNSYPADTATNVTLEQDTDYNGDGTIDAADAAVTFTWADGAGGPALSYIFKLGTANPPTQEFTANASDGFSIFGLALNTTYYWSVTAVNCAGESTETVWSFTTANTLSATDFESEKVFEHYMSSNTLVINASKTLDRVEIYNMLGQVVNTSTPNNNSTTIDLGRLNTGMFIASVSIEGKTQTFKFVK